jgi:cyanophycinase
MPSILRPTKFQPVLVAALVAGGLFAQTPEYGPEKGTLVIQGGGDAGGTGIYETFINLAGGPNAKIIIVPTAGGNRDASGKIKVYKEEEVIGSWKKLGLTDVHMLHTADPKEADTEAFAGVLRDARGVWFVGGRQSNIISRAVLADFAAGELRIHRTCDGFCYLCVHTFY